MSENDDLENRKEDVWSMNEVRSGASDSSDIADTEDGEDSSLDSENADSEDTTDTVDKEDSSDTSDTEDTDNTASGDTVRSMAQDAENKDLAVRDLHNVNVYLYEDIYREMVATFKQLDSEYFADHGEELSKNKEFFNAVFRAGLQSSQIRKELELNDE